MDVKQYLLVCKSEYKFSLSKLRALLFSQYTDLKGYPNEHKVPRAALRHMLTYGSQR